MLTRQQVNSSEPSIITLLLLIALGAVAAMLFTSAIPAIQTQFKVSTASIQWTVSIFVLGYAGGQLIYGPIANRIGRKPTIYLACAFGILGSLLCAIAGYVNNFYLLIAARFIMAVGTSAGLVLTLTIINDVYNHEQTRRVLALVTLAFATFPGIAIFIGGFLVKHFAWESCFYFITAYIIFVTFLCTFLPETKPDIDSNALKLKAIFLNYYQIANSKSLILYSCMWGFCTAIIYLFAAMAPIICISMLGATPTQFGANNLLTSAGYICGTLLARIVSNYLPSRKVMFLGLLLMTTGSLALLFYAGFSMLTIWEFFSTAPIIFVGMPLVFTNASALATKNITDKATGASIMSFLTMILSVFALFFIGAIHTNLAHTLAESFVVITLIIWGLYYLTRNV